MFFRCPNCQKYIRSPDDPASQEFEEHQLCACGEEEKDATALIRFMSVSSNSDDGKPQLHNLLKVRHVSVFG